MEYIVKDGQDIIDVTIQNFGDLESGLFELFSGNNGIGLNSTLSSGQKLTTNNENIGLIREKTYFRQRSFVINNADETIVTTTLGDYNDDFSSDFNNITL